jgi:non-canonical purine NTP pyrophosphatase (RdgB/HAM1 family)
MKDFVFVTGNLDKVHWLEVFLGTAVNHIKLELDEIQSLDPHKVIEHKTKQAFDILQRPVLVEDTSLVFNALSNLPGPFIKYFLQELGNDGICKLLSNYPDKSALATVIYGYYNGEQIHFFEATKRGTITTSPKGTLGHGWDPIFIPENCNKTYAQMTQQEYESSDVSLRKSAVKKFIEFATPNN